MVFMAINHDWFASMWLTYFSSTLFPTVINPFSIHFHRIGTLILFPVTTYFNGEDVLNGAQYLLHWNNKGYIKYQWRKHRHVCTDSDAFSMLMENTNLNILKIYWRKCVSRVDRICTLRTDKLRQVAWKATRPKVDILVSMHCCHVRCKYRPWI